MEAFATKSKPLTFKMFLLAAIILPSGCNTAMQTGNSAQLLGVNHFT